MLHGENRTDFIAHRTDLDHCAAGVEHGHVGGRVLEET